MAVWSRDNCSVTSVLPAQSASSAENGVEIQGKPLGNRPPSLDPEQWVDQHGDALFRYAMLRLQDTDLAEDMVQETLLAAWHSRERFAGYAAERTWLISILRHKLADHLRRCQREWPVSLITSPEQTPEAFFDAQGAWKSAPTAWEADPSVLGEHKQFWEVLTRGLQTLPPRLAEALWLREVEGLDSKEICKALQISQTNLWVRLFRARLQLRRYLEAQWFHRSVET